MLADKLLQAVENLNEAAPEAVSFDGVTDYLSRTTDLVGNVDSKTFTFSAWVYPSPGTNGVRVFNSGGNASGLSYSPADGQFVFDLFDNPVTANQLHVTWITPAFNTFLHILISIDLANPINRHVYVNDLPINATWSTYNNVLVSISHSFYGPLMVNSDLNLLNLAKNRLSNLFLDYTYRDLSIVANRRLFITADGKPASGQELLNPILYLPIKNASTAHINLGTGGNFVQNGTLATADRGANQDNCVASGFDGVDDYLINANIGTISTKTITFSCIISRDTLTNTYHFTNWNGTVLNYFNTYNGAFYFKNSSNINVFQISIQDLLYPTYIDRISHLVVSFDLSDVNKRHVFIDGFDVTNRTGLNPIGWSTYTNDFISISGEVAFNYSTAGPTPVAQKTGEIYIDTAYIDLSVSNPFWDSTTNKPIPVRTAMATLGSNPLICMPIDASNPTINYGSGGNFTLNGGGLVGARGASEFIARSAKGDGVTGYLNNTIIPSMTDSNYISIVTAFKISADTDKLIEATDNPRTKIILSVTPKDLTGQQLTYSINDSAGLAIISATNIPLGLVAGNWVVILMCFDVTSTLPNRVYQGNTLITTPVPANTNQVGFSAMQAMSMLCAVNGSGGFQSTPVAFTYITNQHIDFSQEANRNLFVNQLGYPRDLAPLIADATIPTPLIYLAFDDTANLGKNLGTGGDFTVVGAVTAGADFAI